MGDLIYQDSAVVMSCTVRQTDKEQCMTENLETLPCIVSPGTRHQMQGSISTFVVGYTYN